MRTVERSVVRMRFFGLPADSGDLRRVRGRMTKFGKKSKKRCFFVANYIQ
jgi:hypothetical protein